MLAVSRVAKSYNLTPILKDVTFSVAPGVRVGLIGPNGSGKTTLLRVLMGQERPDEGHFALTPAGLRLGYLAQEQEHLDPAATALDTIQRVATMTETEVRSFLHYFLFEDDEPLRPIASLSYGERSRLSLARLVAEGCTFLLLDEPINHLDIPSRMRFEEALAGYPGTILAVVHDRYFIERFATDGWAVETL